MPVCGIFTSGASTGNLGIGGQENTDYLLSGNEGVITDIILAIKADKTLTLKVKRALIALVEEYRASVMSHES